MVYEQVVQTVDPARRDEYVQVLKRAWKEAAFEGSHDVTILRCIEKPEVLVWLVEWDSVGAHQAHRGTPRHNHFRETTRPYQTQPSQVAHYEVEELAG